MKSDNENNINIRVRDAVSSDTNSVSIGEIPSYLEKLPSFIKARDFVEIKSEDNPHLEKVNVSVRDAADLKTMSVPIGNLMEVLKKYPEAKTSVYTNENNIKIKSDSVASKVDNKPTPYNT